jgi:hypothetical protein
LTICGLQEVIRTSNTHLLKVVLDDSHRTALGYPLAFAQASIPILIMAIFMHCPVIVYSLRFI